MSEKILDEEILKNVNGGANVSPEVSKKTDFEAAWKDLNMEGKGLTGTEMEDLYTQWQIEGFRPDAVTFLSNCKTI